MSLRYKFRHLFFGNKFHKDRMWETLEDLDARITALEESNSTSTPEPSEPSGDDTPSEPSGNDEPSEPSGNDTPSEP